MPPVEMGSEEYCSEPHHSVSRWTLQQPSEKWENAHRTPLNLSAELPELLKHGILFVCSLYHEF